MVRIGVRQGRQHASRDLGRVKAAETIEVTVRGHLVALLVPPGPTTRARDRLAAAGRIFPVLAPSDAHGVFPRVPERPKDPGYRREAGRAARVTLVSYPHWSALMKLLCVQEESSSPPRWLCARTGTPLVSSELVKLKVIRCCPLVNSEVLPEAGSLPAELDLLPLTRDVVNETAEMGETLLGSLGAIHLANAASATDRPTVAPGR
jgi:antitoxin (DNA-binding transcriptional repressor) of toxin-antitoxin stability system